MEVAGADVRIDLTGSAEPPEPAELASFLSDRWEIPVTVRVEVLPSTVFEAATDRGSSATSTDEEATASPAESGSPDG